MTSHIVVSEPYRTIVINIAVSGNYTVKAMTTVASLASWLLIGSVCLGFHDSTLFLECENTHVTLPASVRAQNLLREVMVYNVMT